MVIAGSLELLTIKLRGIEPGQILITKKSPQGRVVPKSRPLVTGAGVSQILKNTGNITLMDNFYFWCISYNFLVCGAGARGSVPRI